MHSLGLAHISELWVVFSECISLSMEKWTAFETPQTKQIYNFTGVCECVRTHCAFLFLFRTTECQLKPNDPIVNSIRPAEVGSCCYCGWIQERDVPFSTVAQSPDPQRIMGLLLTTVSLIHCYSPHRKIILAAG